MRAACSDGVGVGSGVAGAAVGADVGPADRAAAPAVGVALAVVTRGVTASVGTTVETGALVATLTRTGGSARPALRNASAATAPINPSSSKLLRTCQMVMRRRPPFDTNGRPHQSHSLEVARFLPPQPGQIATSSVTGGTGIRIARPCAMYGLWARSASGLWGLRPPGASRCEVNPA